MNGWIIVFGNVSTNDIVSLRKSNDVETVLQLFIFTNGCRKCVHRSVHVQEVAIVASLALRSIAADSTIGDALKACIVAEVVGVKTL